MNPTDIKLYQPAKNSHKGQNGKLLVIGGSKLFHSSIFWSADVASRVVDLVHFTSPANENNDLVRKKLKEGFWNGIVIDWGDVERYIEEDDCVLIGPGMVREETPDATTRVSQVSQLARSSVQNGTTSGLSEAPTKRNSKTPRMFSDGASIPSEQSDRVALEHWGAEDKTKEIIDFLLKKFPSKRWVIDGGALQEVEPGLITKSCILTPHRKEFQRLVEKVNFSENSENSKTRISSENQKARDPENPSLRPSGSPNLRRSDYSECSGLSTKLNSCTILLKGPADTVCQGSRCVFIEGGNPGMTKGGTGDVLAGLVAALYCKDDFWTAATIGSWVNKRAGDELYKRVGPYFNATDLANEIPRIIKHLREYNSREQKSFID